MHAPWQLCCLFVGHQVTALLFVCWSPGDSSVVCALITRWQLCLHVDHQVTALLRRMLPDITPSTLATVMDVTDLPEEDFSLSLRDSADDSVTFDPHKLAILDVFLACIAKALTVQTKVKGHANSKSVLQTCQLHLSWWVRSLFIRSRFHEALAPY